MKIPRSTVDAALFSVLSGAYAWVMKSMHWQSWETTTQSQPAMFLRKVPEDVSQDKRGLNKYVLSYEVWVYAQVNYNDPLIDPLSTVVNPILDAIDNAIAPDPATEWQNLGLPEVANCRISGKVDVCDGSSDGQAIMVMTILVFVGS